MILDTDDIWFCEKCQHAFEAGSQCDCKEQAPTSPRGDAAGVGKSSPAVQSQTTPTKERDAARIALAKAVVAQLTALNRTHAQARLTGVRIDFSLTGIDHTPEIKNAYYVQPSGNVKNIWDEVFK